MWKDFIHLAHSPRTHSSQFISYCQLKLIWSLWESRCLSLMPLDCGVRGSTGGTMCHVPACLRGLCQKPCFLSIHCTHRHTRPHMQLHIERNACGEAAALCCFFFFLPCWHEKRANLWTVKRIASLPGLLGLMFGLIPLPPPFPPQPPPGDMCFWSVYHNIVISLTAFSSAGIRIEFHMWMRRRTAFENHQRKQTNDKQRPSVSHWVVCDLNPPGKPHPQNSLPHQMYKPGCTSCQKFQKKTQIDIFIPRSKWFCFVGLWSDTGIRSGLYSKYLLCQTFVHLK